MKTQLLQRLLVVGLMISSLGIANTVTAESSGEFRLGGVLLDTYGSNASYMPAQQYYEGLSLSFDRIRYSDPLWRFSGHARNMTLNSRDLAFTFGHLNHFSVSARNDQTTRVYSASGDQFGRRHLTQFDLWMEPIESFRVFGSYGIQDRNGVILSSIFPTDSISISSSDFGQKTARFGARYDNDGYVLEGDMRIRDYNDRSDNNRDREGTRYRVSGRAPMPGIKQVFLNGGFMQYTEAYKNTPDSFLTNTGWGGLRWVSLNGASVKYSFVYDRSRKTGDLLATDNITQSISVAKNWMRKGGVQVGGLYRYRDNLTTVLETFGFNGSAWIALTDQLTIRGAAGTESREMEEGSLINGVRGLDRGFIQAEYRKNPLQLRLRYSIETRSYDDLGTTNDIDQLSADGSYSISKIGNFSANYAYRMADQQSTEGKYNYDEHLVAGDFTSASFGKLRGTMSGLYQRATGDIDVETANGTAGLRYDISRRVAIDGKYSAFNFDNFTQRDIPATLYTDYSTLNVIELALVVSW